MKKIFLTISNKFEKLGRQEDIAWYTFDESSYEKVITALDVIQEEEAKWGRKVVVYHHFNRPLSTFFTT